MKRLLFYVIILFAAVFIGIEMHKDPGYVLISYQKWSVESSLWFAIFATLVAFFIIYIIAKLLRGTLRLSHYFHLWNKRRRKHKARSLTNQGLCHLAEGNWISAEKTLIKAVAHSDTPLINYLGAARSAQGQSKYHKRDNYLKKAANSTPGSEVAVGLTQAELQLRAEQLEQALATLQHLHQVDPHHAYVLKLLQSAYHKLQDWESLLAIIPELKKRKVLKPEQLQALEQTVHLQLLIASTHSENINALHKTWKNIPKHLQHDTQLVMTYAQYLSAHNHSADAEELLRNALKRNWDIELVKQYGKTIGAHPDKQLAVAESWLNTHGSDPELLLCLGRICIQNKLWGKAQTYLETSVTLAPKPITYRVLGQLLDKQGNKAAALDSFKKGLLAAG